MKTKPFKPCRKCGCEERYVVSRVCPNCNKKKSLEWQKKNPEKHRELSKIWYEKNKEKVKKYNYRKNQKKIYGSAPDAELTAKRRALEERRELRELWLECN